MEIAEEIEYFHNFLCVYLYSKIIIYLFIFIFLIYVLYF